VPFKGHDQQDTQGCLSKDTTNRTLRGAFQRTRPICSNSFSFCDSQTIPPATAVP